jgi:hypothetical protein
VREELRAELALRGVRDVAGVANRAHADALSTVPTLDPHVSVVSEKPLENGQKVDA